tara:strand:+ start:109 stop:720 length:612 start_codon:yes stop_codon:yes gene_type:complete
MNDLKKIAKKSKNIIEFSKNYFKRLSKIYEAIDKNKIKQLEKKLHEIRINGGNIFVIGNGGSAANASSMANDLGFDVIKKTKIKKCFKIFSLNDNTSVLTAISNDIGYENLFVGQLKIHFKKKDMIIILSASGNSKNLLKAANWVKKNNGYVFSIIGFDGGKLKKLSNNCIHIKSNSDEYGPVEDIQLIINHILAHWFQKIFN